MSVDIEAAPGTNFYDGPGISEFSTYEYLDEYGDVPPHQEELKQQLFGDLAKDMTVQGEYMKLITSLPVKIERDDKIRAVKSVRFPWIECYYN